MHRWAILVCGLLVSMTARADERDAHRIASILDYVASDYGLSVKDGRVVSKGEYEEQLAFAATARSLLRELADPRAVDLRPRLDADLAALEAAIRRLAPPAEVARLCARARSTLVAGLALVVTPSRPPSLPRARELYAQACADCHGESGRADGRRARELTPAPVSFHLPERMESMTPYRVFNALTFGVPGTAMASFEDALSAADRWSLAYYVLALRHMGVPPQPAPKVSISALATSSDAQIRELLASRSVAPADVAGALAALRARDAFAPTDHDRHLARARELLDEALAAFRRGDGATASRSALDAYLEGFDPVEPALRLRGADLVQRVEATFVSLRGAMERGDAGAVRASAATLHAALRDAEEILVVRRGGGAVAFAGSFLILLREGVEAALLIAALLGILARIGQRRAQRWVHYGWLAALAAGAGTWAAAQGLVRLGAARREILEGVLSLCAAAVLFYVSYWLVSKVDVRRWMAFLKEKLLAQAGKPGGLFAVAGISFLAVYREALETVLFYQALLLDAQGHELAVAGGAGAGAVAIVLAVLAIFRLGKHLPLRAFFLASGVVLCLLAAVIAGKGIHALQDAGVLPHAPLSFARVEWLGVYPDAWSLGVQGAIALALAAAGAWSLRRRRRAA